MNEIFEKFLSHNFVKDFKDLFSKGDVTKAVQVIQSLHQLIAALEQIYADNHEEFNKALENLKNIIEQHKKT